jgi:MFS family permease
VARPVLVLLVATTVQTLGAVVYQSLGVVGPILVDDLRLSAVQFGVIPSAMHLGSLAALVVGASLVERLGATRLLGIGGLVSAVALAAAAAAGGYAVLLACLVVVGAVWGISAIAGGEEIILAAPPRRRATVTSLRQLALPIGGLIAAAIGPLALSIGWQGLLLMQAAALGLVASWILGSRALTGHRRRRTSWIQMPTPRGAALGSVAIGLTAGQAAFLVYAVLELTGRVGLDFTLAAAIFLAGQAIGAAYRAGLGAISDAVPWTRTRLLAVNSLAAAAAALAFGALSPETPVWLVAATVLFASAVIIGWNGVLVVALLEAAAPAHVNRNLSAGMTLMRVGIIGGPPVFGAILAAFGSAVAWMVIAGIFVGIGVAFATMGPGPIERHSFEAVPATGAPPRR